VALQTVEQRGLIGVDHTPRPGDLDLTGLTVAPDAVSELLAVDQDGWRGEITQLGTYLADYGDRLPPALESERREILKRLGA